MVQERQPLRQNLARYLKKQGRAPALIACDLHRPAAIDQLATLGSQIDVPVYSPDSSEKNVQRAAAAGLEWASQKAC